MKDRERRKILDIDVARDGAVILNVEPDEGHIRPEFREALEHDSEFPAGPAPGCAQAHDQIGLAQPFGLRCSP
jgi:hypothetical protein